MRANLQREKPAEERWKHANERWKGDLPVVPYETQPSRDEVIERAPQQIGRWLKESPCSVRLVGFVGFIRGRGGGQRDGFGVGDERFERTEGKELQRRCRAQPAR